MNAVIQPGRMAAFRAKAVIGLESFSTTATDPKRTLGTQLVSGASVVALTANTAISE